MSVQKTKTLTKMAFLLVMAMMCIVMSAVLFKNYQQEIEIKKLKNKLKLYLNGKKGQTEETEKPGDTGHEPTEPTS